MILDSSALINLEILESSYDPIDTSKGSLFKFLDSTITSFGKRMMKSWCCTPLTNVQLIN
jgi:DNA mismatch repair protein MSH6